MDFAWIIYPTTVGSVLSCSFRNAAYYQTIGCYTQLYFNSILSPAIRDWNNLSSAIRKFASLTSFKYQWNANLAQQPSFYAENRIGQIYYSRLRTNCSFFNSHLFSKNIKDSSFCSCGAIKTLNITALYTR